MSLASVCICTLDRVIHGCPKHHPAEQATLRSVHVMLIRILENQEQIMSQQSDIDAATQAILGLVTNIQSEDANLGSAVSAIQAFIAAQPASVDTTALDAAVAQISGAQDSLNTAVSSVSGIVPAAPVAPPAA